MDTTHHMHNHFSRVAPSYREARTTDIEPIQFIAENLKDLPEVKAADIGCGAGRYDLLLFQHLKNLHLTCIDNNESMLEETKDYLKSYGITNFETLKSDAADLPLEDNSMDCILTFNAIHHFDFLKFTEKCSRIVKESGKIFIYTRSRSQNAKNIWGQHFPLFLDKETRLYELEQMERWVRSAYYLKLEEVKPFQYKRDATLEQLVEKARTRYYSTFSLYEEDELEKALATFQENIRKHFPKTDRIEWFDENVLLVLNSTP